MKEEVACAGCGKSLMAWPSSKRKYCSKACARKGRIGSGRDRKGEVSGRLTFLYPVAVRSKTHWMCQCECGKLTLIRPSKLHTTASCGCLQKDSVVKRNQAGWKGHGEISGNYLTQIRTGAKTRGYEYALDPEWLWKLYLEQGRMCKLSGLPIAFGSKRSMGQTASLDRIDPLVGYVVGNVQWVHRTINLLRNTVGVDEFISLCKIVAKHNEK